MNVSEILGRKSRLLDQGVGRSVEGGEEGPKPGWRLGDDVGVQRLQPQSEAHERGPW